jgi:hypothetical protein
MEQFANTLTGINKVLYTTSYEFHMKYSQNPTHESAHQAGLDKIASTEELMKTLEGEQDYVDVSTGRRFRCTEAQLMSRHA